MTTFDVARKRKNLTLEETLIEGIEKMLEEAGVSSFSAYIEGLLAAHLIANNKLSPTYRLPGETRGGDQYSKRTKKKKKAATDDSDKV